MNQTAYVVLNDEITNVIVVDENTDLSLFNATVDPSIPAEAGNGWKLIGGKWTAPELAQTEPAALGDLRSAALSAITTTADALLATGAPVSGGLHVALNDGARADLTAMAATATAAASGAVAWPASYSRGWITVENTRIPLATPAVGLALAASVGDWYARVIQHRRDLKDQVLAAADEAALDTIDITAGWPA